MEEYGGPLVGIGKPSKLKRVGRALKGPGVLRSFKRDGKPSN